jgi:inosine-uridine nucleoside N-ribohydrolase
MSFQYPQRIPTFLFLLLLFFVTSPLFAKNSSDLKPLPVVVDTDMGFDDWMAILYLLNNPAVDLKAITIDCAGETYCPQGAVNATRLIEIAGQSQIPVFYGDTPLSTFAYQYPTLIRYGATSMEVPGFEDKQGVPFYTDNAAGHLQRMIVEAGQAGVPLTVISIGSSTNLAAAIKLTNNHADFKKGIKRIFKGGGVIGQVINGKLSNQGIKGNISIPGILSSDNKTAEWNIYPNAEAAQQLFSSGLPITLVPINLSNNVPITKASFNTLLTIANTPEAHFVVSVIDRNVQVQGGWDKVELDYWDPSVVVSAINPEMVTKQFSDVPLCVQTENNQYHGTTYVYDMCNSLKVGSGTLEIYTEIPQKAFLDEFFGVLNLIPQNE